MHCLSERRIEKYLLANIRHDLEEFMIQAETEQAQKKRQPKVKDIISLNEQLRRLNVVYISGNLSDEEYAAETKRIKVEIEKAKQEDEEYRPVNVEGLKAFLESDVLATYPSLNKEEQRRLWRSIIQEIHVEGTTVKHVVFRP